MVANQHHWKFDTGKSVIDAYHIEHVMMSKNHGLSPSTVVSTAEAEKFTFAIVTITSVQVDTSAAVLAFRLSRR